MPGGSDQVYRYGTVEYVGPGRHSEYNGKLIPVDVKCGDRVIYHHAHGQPVDVEAGEFHLLAYSQVLAVSDPTDGEDK